MNLYFELAMITRSGRVSLTLRFRDVMVIFLLLFSVLAPKTERVQAADFPLEHLENDGQDNEFSGIGGQREPRFYRGLDEGSESQFNSLNIIVNMGLMSYGRLGTQSKLQSIGTAGAISRLSSAYLHPIDAIGERGGLLPFVASEFLLPVIVPIHPNLTLHFIGEGLVSRKLEESYLANGYSPFWSKSLAIGTIVFAQQFNEVVEQQSPFIDKADPLGDLVWNTLGILAFQRDDIADFFQSEMLQTYYWPGQAVIDTRSGTIFNQGEMYCFRTPLIRQSPWTLSFITGAPLMSLGLSYSPWYQNHITAGIGFIFPVEENPVGSVAVENNIDKIKGVVDHLPKGSGPGYSFFWDRQGSLMASLAVRVNLRGFWLNLYPGVLSLGPFKFGLYADLHLDKRNNAIGLTFSWLPAIAGWRF